MNNHLACFLVSVQHPDRFGGHPESSEGPAGAAQMEKQVLRVA